MSEPKMATAMMHVLPRQAVAVSPSDRTHTDLQQLFTKNKNKAVRMETSGGCLSYLHALVHCLCTGWRVMCGLDSLKELLPPEVL